jgi:hypothetical protein
VKTFGLLSQSRTAHLITTQSCTDLRQIPAESVDYVFVDPPFGRNLQYSELNQVWEAWLRIKTQRSPEAVMDSTRQREVMEYASLMSDGFGELFRVLKPGRWITVVFHNSSNAVWFAIQEAIFRSGLVVADVRTLDRESDTYKQSRQGLVKQDLVISSYKPTKALEQRFQVLAGTEKSAWDFVDNHLRQLPSPVVTKGKIEVNPERQSYLLFDRMLAFHVQRGVSVPLSASGFMAGLKHRYSERNGMYFLPDQVTVFDRIFLEIKEVEQLELFVSEEKSAIQWLRSRLAEQPMTYQDLQPLYMQKAQLSWEKFEQPLELLSILESNFLKDSTGKWRIPDPRSEADLEHLRSQMLIKEFRKYVVEKGRLKVVRCEALRAGFKDCWQKGDYGTIIQMAKRVPEAVVQEDPALLMYYDNALMRKGE